MAAKDHGRFCWYDLMSTDPAGSKDFYTKLFGWRVEPTSMEGMGEMKYDMLYMGDRPLGGVVPLGPDDGLPTHWIPYVAVKDVHETCETVGSKGGQVCVPPTSIGPGTFAVANDPQGAFISIWQNEEEMPPDAPNGTPGLFCWNECMSTDAAAGADFYAAVFGWKPNAMEMEVGGCRMTYRTFEMEDGHHAGIMDLPPDALEQGAKPHWLSYVTVDDCDTAMEKAKGLGATVLCPPTDIPDTGRFCVIQDPQGGMLSLFTYSEEML